MTHDERSRRTERLAWSAHRATENSERTHAQCEIVCLNIRIARAIAARYRGRGIAIEDLEQIACEGLIKAVQRFDPTLHHDLLSYAVPTIRGELLRSFRDLSWVIRPPRRLQELERRIACAAAELGSQLERGPTSEEVCTHLGIDRTDHREIAAAIRRFRPISLDQPLGVDDATSLGELVADSVDLLGVAEDRAVLAPALRELSDRDRRILYLRFVEDRTQREIGEELGVSQMQVSRWLTRIVAQLRHRLTATETAPVGPDRRRPTRPRLRAVEG